MANDVMRFDFEESELRICSKQHNYYIPTLTRNELTPAIYLDDHSSSNYKSFRQVSRGTLL